MIDRVAKALYWDDYADRREAWDDADDSVKEDYRGHARAAIEAMRELSETDVSACHMEPTTRELKYWRAMIDAALAIQPPT